MLNLKQISNECRKNCFDGVYWHCGDDSYMEGKKKYYQFEKEFSNRVITIHARAIRMLGGDKKSNSRGAVRRQEMNEFDAKVVKFEDNFYRRLCETAFEVNPLFLLEKLALRNMRHLR